jgi:hypothetical protein
MPGASKFWNPIFGPVSWGAVGTNAGAVDEDIALALPEY